MKSVMLLHSTCLVAIPFSGLITCHQQLCVSRLSNRSYPANDMNQNEASLPALAPRSEPCSATQLSSTDHAHVRRAARSASSPSRRPSPSRVRRSTARSRPLTGTRSRVREGRDCLPSSWQGRGRAMRLSIAACRDPRSRASLHLSASNQPATGSEAPRLGRKSENASSYRCRWSHASVQVPLPRL